MTNVGLLCFQDVTNRARNRGIGNFVLVQLAFSRKLRLVDIRLSLIHI